MDVVVTADSELVVSHEPWMSSRICRHPGGAEVTEDEEQSLIIYGMTYPEVAEFDCGSRRAPGFPHQRLEAAPKPLLRDVIDMAETTAAELGMDPVRYNVETKSRPSWDNRYHPEPRVFAELLYSVLRDAVVLERSTIQSFDVRTLREARRLDRAWRTSLLAGRMAAPFLALNVRRLGFVPSIYSPHHRAVNARRVLRAHRRGMSVIPWTANSEEEIARLVELGVDGLITDYPDRAKRVLERFLGSSAA